MDDLPEWYVATLAAQRAMTAQTWQVLVERGADEQLWLEFYFDAPDRAGAEELARFLVAETDFEIFTTHDEADAAVGPGWLVGGRTRELRASPEKLDEWVSFMVTAGAQHGRCVFDGWGVTVPSRALPVQ
jgi:Regulator of ribonuclease activity B